MKKSLRGIVISFSLLLVVAVSMFVLDPFERSEQKIDDTEGQSSLEGIARPAEERELTPERLAQLERRVTVELQKHNFSALAKTRTLLRNHDPALAQRPVDILLAATWAEGEYLVKRLQLRYMLESCRAGDRLKAAELSASLGVKEEEVLEHYQTAAQLDPHNLEYLEELERLERRH